MSIPRMTKAMNHIDEDLISDAVAYRRVKNKNAWVKWGAAAACLCLAAAGTISWQKAAKPVEEVPGVVPTENGETIPKMETSLPSNSEFQLEYDQVETCWESAFFFYHGNRYVQYEWVEDADFVGEYLGTATGSDEWTWQEGYVELAGSVKGDFFAAKGYDPAFMLCMKQEPGKVSLYVCDSGATLKYGSELYEDWLHLSDGYNVVRYETRRSWRCGKGELYQMNGTNEVIDSFIEQLNKAEFIRWDDVKREGEIYHLYFKRADGVTIHLRLYENGYVRFEGIKDVGVQVPEDSFNPLIDLLKGHVDAEPIAAADPGGS